MVKNSLVVLIVLVVAGLVGCGGNGLPTPPSGGAFIEQVGDQVRVRGQLAFTDAAGNPVDPPAGGAVVVVGGASLAAGTDSIGRFLILGFLPLVQGMLVRAGAVGFLPCYATIPPNATSLPEGTLALVEDTNPQNNLTIEDEEFETWIGTVWLSGTIPNGAGADLVAFWSEGDNLDSFGGAEGVALETQLFQGTGDDRLFRVTLPEAFGTGRLFASVFDPTSGFSMFAARTCDMRIQDWAQALNNVSGNVFQGNTALQGAVVNVWEENNPGNGDSYPQTDSNGWFGISLPQGYSSGDSVMALVQWQDAAGKLHCCKFRDGVPVG